MIITSKLRSLVIGSLLGISASYLVGCNSTPTNPRSEGQTTVEFWTMQLQPQFTPYFNELNTTFESKNQGVKVRWVDIPWTAMESKILTAVSAKTAPDVVNLNPSFASQLASRQAWLDLSTKVPPQIQGEYLANIWNASTIELCEAQQCSNVTFGLPWYLTSPVTIYNKDLLSRAEVAEIPKTYEELAQVAAKVKEKTGKYAFFVTFVPGDSGEVLESLVQMGVKLIDEQGKAAFNTPEGVEAFRYWVSLYEKGLLPPEVLTQGHQQGIELYQSGETALLSSGVEFFGAIAKNAPAIAAVSGAAPQITGKTGKKNVAVMNLVIPRDTDQPDQALNYALFVTNTDNQLAFAKAANVLPSTVKSVDLLIQELEQKSDKTPLEEALKVSATQLKDAEVLVPAMKDLNQLQKIIYENLQKAMLKEQTVEEAVKNASESWNNR
jgi:putative chitobiose transport system substrate-binding protein